MQMQRYTPSKVEQLAKLMSDGQWFSIPQIAEALEMSQTGASARLRDLRKVEYGCHVVERSSRNEDGVYLYRIVKNDLYKIVERV